MVLDWLFEDRDRKKAARHKPAPPPRTRLGIEQLEDRTVPALSFNVNTLGDLRDAMLDGNALDMNGNTSLRAAIEEGENAADLNITINLAGVNGNILLGSALDNLTKNYTISGPGSANLMISRASAAQFRIFTLDTPERTSSITGLSFENGNPLLGDGGAIKNRANLVLSDCYFVCNAALSGGAVYNTGHLTASGCVAEQNLAEIAGGAFFNAGTLILNLGCSIADNFAGIGGGIYNEGTFTVRDSSVIWGNEASSKGGGVYNAGTFTMEGGNIWHNRAGQQGGGFYNLKDGNSATLTGVDIGFNWALGPNGEGGGFFAQRGFLQFLDCTLGNNFAAIGAGGAYFWPDADYIFVGGWIFDPIDMV